MPNAMPDLNVLIVGASIAGPTAAYWFAKAGAKVTVIERFPHLRTNGQNVDIRTVGVTVMRKMPGMEAAVRSRSVPLEGFNFVRPNGKPFATIRTTGNPDQQSLISEYEIYRGELSQILFDMAKDNENVNYVFGEQVVSMQHHHSQNDSGDNDGPITVEFANGLPTSDYDLVIACDGANSRTRAIGLGCGVRDHTKSMNWWAAYFSISENFFGKSRMGEAYNAVGGRFVGLGPGAEGTSQATLMGIHRQNSNGPEIMQQFRQAQKQGTDDGLALKQFVAQQYTGAGWKCDQIMKGMMESEDFYAAEFVQVKLPSLYKGRFVLVGDAGYACGLGSGTSLAIAGAYVLAGEICKHKNNLPAGLQAYEERMRPIIDELQKVPPFLTAALAPQTSWGLWLRNSILAFISWTRVIELCQTLFGGAFAGTDKFKLPDYKWEVM